MYVCLYVYVGNHNNFPSQWAHPKSTANEQWPKDKCLIIMTNMYTGYMHLLRILLLFYFIIFCLTMSNKIICLLCSLLCCCTTQTNRQKYDIKSRKRHTLHVQLDVSKYEYEYVCTGAWKMKRLQRPSHASTHNAKS